MRIRATTKLQNDKMVAARERLGLNQTQAAEAAGISRAAWICLEKLRYSRYRPDTIEQHATTISLYLGIPAEDIAPRELWGSEIPSSHKVVRNVEPKDLLEAVSTHEQHYLLAEPSTELEQEEAHEVLDGALEALSSREREVLDLRYGLTGGISYTHRDIARITKVSNARVDQIEQAALRKLRHPARGQRLPHLV